LLNQIDGYKTIPKGIVMHTAGAEITTVKMGLWRQILDFLIDPNLISLMLSLGVLGLIVELWHPGLIFPATFGILCLAIAFYGLDVLPVNWAGLILIAAAFAFWIAELFIAFSHGALTLAGAACFVFGTLLLFQPAGSGYQVSVWVSVAVAVTVSAFFALALAKVIQIRRRPPSVGPTAIVGSHGEVRTDGLVSVNGELWKARVENGEHLARGEDIEVVALDGLELVVRRVKTAALGRVTP
jgi:membrane-bound serine protease (ClpP class)